MIITIDGPSGTGKSTTAKRLASALQIAYLDTGAIYRSLAWFFLEEKIDPANEAEGKKALKRFHLEITEDENYIVSGKNITKELRKEKISTLSSTVSAFPYIRKHLRKIQRGCMSKRSGVVEGRDIGSAVFPKADVKIFLTASLASRAKRRHLQLKEQFPDQDFSLKDIEEKLDQRDQADSTRASCPLKKTSDMYVIDTTNLSLEEVLIAILHRIPRKKMRFFYRMIFQIAWGIFRCFYRFRVYGKQHLFAGPALVIANHTSYFDPHMTVLAMKEELHILARNTLFRQKLLASLIL